MTPAPALWPAPAKLNLFLHVVGRRPDGYHLLQTVFQFLGHGDWIELAVRNVVHDRPVRNTDALVNPDALENFRDIEELSVA